MNLEIKKPIERAFDFFAYIDNTLKTELKVLDSNIDTMKIMKTELIKYILYLRNSGGEISYYERDFIETYLDIYLPKEKAKSLILELNLNKNNFANEQPASFKILYAFDEITYESDDDTPTTGVLYSVYQLIGKAFLSQSDICTQSQVDTYEDYLNSLKKYIYTNLDKNKSNTSQNNIESKNTIAEENNTTTIEELLDNLNELVGLDNVKQDVKSLINLLKIRKIREERGMTQPPMSLHLVFSGNPGTGKTTVARLLSQIYCKLGILSKGHLIEVDRSGLVGGYVGQTAIKVKEVIDKAKGGVLFIDEAYSLTNNKDGNDYGTEAVDTLIKGMEDNRDDLIVIVAGYPKLMEDFLQSNPGLRSRFNKFINFDDYDADELLKIYDNMCVSNSLSLTEEAKTYVYNYFSSISSNKNINFGNARDVRNFFEQTLIKQADRLSSGGLISDADLSNITIEDVREITV